MHLFRKNCVYDVQKSTHIFVSDNIILFHKSFMTSNFVLKHIMTSLSDPPYLIEHRLYKILNFIFFFFFWGGGGFRKNVYFWGGMKNIFLFT